MRRPTCAALIVCLGLAMAAVPVSAAPLTSVFTYQGELRDGGGLASGTHDLRFRLFDAASGGAPVGPTVCLDNVAVDEGRFTVALDFGVDPFDGQARWLEVSVRPDSTAGNCGTGSYTTLTPRQPVTAAPYALQTRGLFVDNDLDVGIGTATPGARLDVVAPTGRAVVANSAAGIDAIRGITGGEAPFPFSDDAGVRGDGNGTSQAGVLGVSTNYVAVVGYTASGAVGVFGRHDGANGVALLGTATQPGGVGVRTSGEIAADLSGRVLIFDTSPLGIQFTGHGEAGADTGLGHPGDGVLTFITNNVERARLDPSGALIVNAPAMLGGTGTKFHSNTGECITWNTDSNSAVAGETSSGVAVDAITDNGYAVVGACQSNTVGMAGLFVGRVSVNGTFSASSKNFKIDHPLDPANRYLTHACVESDQRATLYRGTVVLDGSGSAWVQMPEWFHALNVNFAYQLTAIGAPMPNLHIAREIQDGVFLIAGGHPGAKVSWQVTGERHDAFARAYPLEVEEVKAPADRGRYLNPVVHGAPYWQRIGPPLSAPPTSHR